MRWLNSIRPLCFGALCLGTSIKASAQFDVDFTRRDFFEVRSELRSYYDSLIAIGDTASALFAEGGKYAQYNQWDEFWSSRIPAGKTFEDFSRAEAAAFHSLNARKNANRSNGDEWHEIGPLDRPNSGQSGLGTQNSQPGIGPIEFITFCDADPSGNLVLCGSEGGGLFRRDMSTTTRWLNAGSDDWPISGCKHAVFQPGSCEIIYAANPNYLRSLGGIHRYDPVTTTWVQIADWVDLGMWNQINKLQTDIDNPDVLYAATTDGLFRSVNVNAPDPATVVWTKLLLPAPTDDPVYGTYIYNEWQWIEDIEMEPGNGEHIYVSVKLTGIDPNDNNHTVEYWRLMRSLDRGTTWFEVPNQPAHQWVTANATNHVDKYAEQITIEVSPDLPNSIFAIFDLISNPQSNFNDKLYRIDNAANTATWILVRSNLYTWYGGGHGFGVSPTDHSTIYMANEDRYLVVNGNTVVDYNVNTGNDNQYHVDVEDIVGRPEHANEVWMADHGSVHRSLDNGATWEFIGQGLGVADCYGTAPSYSEPGRIAIGLNHDGNILSDGNYYPNWEPEWQQLGGLDGQHPMIDPVHGEYIYWHSQYNYGFSRSDDYGVTSVSIPPGYHDWNTTNIIDHERPNIFYVATNNVYLKRTMDRGNSYETIANFDQLTSTIPTTGDKILWKVYTSWSNPEVVLAHFICRSNANGIPDQQILFRNNNARASASTVMNTWEQLELPLSTGSWLGTMVVDHDDPNVIYFGRASSLVNEISADGSEMLFRVNYNLSTMDPGYITDLTTIGSSSLPNTGAGRVVLERGSNGGIYFGTDIGVFYTNNEFISDGTGWVLLGPDLPHVAIRDLQINYVANKIRASLPGRGIWEHDLYCPELTDKHELGVHSVDLYREVQHDITSTATVLPTINVTYRAGSEIMLQPGFHASKESAFHAFIHGCDQPGNSFKSMRYSADSSQSENTRVTSKEDRALLVYPNPSRSGLFTIELVDHEDKIQSIEVYNLSGAVQAYQFKQLAHATWALSLSENIGLYIAKVTTERGECYTHKINIQ